MTRHHLTVAGVLVVCGVVIGWVRPRLAHTVEEVRARSAVYSLPPPHILARGSLGYRAALADYLWAHVLVTQGLRMKDRRPFEELASYLDAINYLAPDFREPYRVADSLMAFQVNDPNRAASTRRARGILERGLERFPFDAELWLNYGQFLAYVGPGALPEDSGEREKWRKDGALALVRAGELGASDRSLLYRSMGAATILSRTGELDAAIRFMERIYAMSEDEAVRADVLRRLNGLRQSRAESRDFLLSTKYDELWRRELPFAPRVRLSVLGPAVDTWRCAGPRTTGEVQCSRDWHEWASHAVPSSLDGL